MRLHVFPTLQDEDSLLLVRASDHESPAQAFAARAGAVVIRDDFFSALKWYQSRYDDVIIHFDQSSLQY